MYNEAMRITKSTTGQTSTDTRRMESTILIKQAKILRQKAKSGKAIPLLESSLSIRTRLLNELPDSKDASMDVAFALDQIGQVLLQDGSFAKAGIYFEKENEIFEQRGLKEPNDDSIQRLLSVSYSRSAMLRSTTAVSFKQQRFTKRIWPLQTVSGDSHVLRS